MSRTTTASGTPVIIVTLLVAAWLEVLPLPDVIEYFRPEWLAVAMVYWTIALPHRIGVVWGASVGLFQDVLLGTVLGQHALAMTLVVFIAQSSYKRMRVFPLPQQSAVVFMLIGVAVISSYLIQGIAGRAHLPPLAMLLSALTSAVFWRPAFSLLRWTRRQFLVR
ncbi:MAG: rod shape-determining protein MreD [Gammaproteobacteria bacterium]|jgi:rod shape-determining protein MreD|nr:rod shape-determining protein MreD [Gammaproteobacteria bacterium]MBQ0775295.1 rod shape-determining protein MreD [Gammaproteobacteria bacterium]|tara:strand:- start:136851 stop:137345 length:495 start_codon:yes stop_codon:yes gene_type:complete